MKKKRMILLLGILVTVLAAIVSAYGLFSHTGGRPFIYRTIRGQDVHIQGGGLYQWDTVFFAEGFRGADSVMLFLGVPLLIVTIYKYYRGSFRAQVFLMGLMTYSLYFYASMALGAAYNHFFLAYITIYSASLYALICLFSETILPEICDKMPHRSLTAFMIVAGLLTMVGWLSPLISALIDNAVPDKMDNYTTMVTYALDLGIITPALLICAGLVSRRDPLGYKIAVPLLTVIIPLVPQIVLSTIYQKNAGIVFSIGEMIGPITGFIVLGVSAIWLLFMILKNLPSSQ